MPLGPFTACLPSVHLLRKFWTRYLSTEREINRGANPATLDLFSTSPTTALQERKALCSPCIHNAPYFAYPTTDKSWTVTQGNCHHWDCPRCGLGRAKQEYGRMVEGCRLLAENYPLYFITITCRGKEISHEYAEENYGKWTNRLLDACRLQRKRSGGEWHYVQVTERQKRLHPHSHFITTFLPKGSVVTTGRKTFLEPDGQRRIQRLSSIRSEWFAAALKRCGLGSQYNITRVESAEGASRYVAKYLFKSTIFEANWPKGWKRIRYSQGFPKAPEREGEAIVLLKTEDWVHLSYRAVVVNCPDLDVYETVSLKMTGSDCLIRLRTA
jgi:hypothetical protein